MGLALGVVSLDLFFPATRTLQLLLEALPGTGVPALQEKLV